MKKRWLSALLGGVLLLSLGAAPSAGAPQSSESSRRPNVNPCRWVLFQPQQVAGEPIADAYWKLDCSFRDVPNYDLSAINASAIEHDAAQALKKVIRRYLQSAKAA